MFFQGVGKCDAWTQSAFVMPMMRGADAIYANQANYWTDENPDPNADFPRMWRVMQEKVQSAYLI